MSKPRVKIKLSKKRAEGSEQSVSKGLKAALEAREARTGQPTELDAPPPSTFPMTPAAAEALRLSKDKRWGGNSQSVTE